MIRHVNIGIIVIITMSEIYYCPGIDSSYGAVQSPNYSLNIQVIKMETACGVERVSFDSYNAN